MRKRYSYGFHFTGKGKAYQESSGLFPYSYIEIATYLGFSSQVIWEFSLLCHSIHCFILIQHLRMILLLNLDICQQLAYTTVAKGKYIIIVCS